ncbi:sn-glycerol-3-phosphate ABC transporter permease UgpA [candidate division KSB3 bacterium]|uniref:sn-glycerol-3-phosphate transport system permease protein UgpA n=1 Tax=candidate division KSB3 bacterium TaxID=2044937 RepID=A0A2G6E8Q4_9BACT|nr:MAG: sn-glycerol-3-phosphate ABC transporter permease UgpA [candidate division KSB3 bacterium]PIE30503.1 MAG: sn-glycerol-3-phosphate ABC transporter permease UgpA [candidate division KSB3 bacterium]
MEKRVFFRHKFLPYVLVTPQIVVILIFFLWPASQALYQSMLREDAFGLSSEFVWFENFQDIFSSTLYLHSLYVSVIFSVAVAVVTMVVALFLAVMADRVVHGASAYKALIVWPYAVAPAVAGVLWLFMFNPTVGILTFLLKILGYEWDHALNGNQAFILVVIAASWKRISYNFLFFLAGLQTVPKTLVEAAAIDGARPFRRFWDIVFPLLTPTTFFLLVMNGIYAFFETFGIIHQITGGGPNYATEILVYKVFRDGFLSLDLGGSAAQSVVLMTIVIVLTVVQFRYVEKKVHY